MLEIVEAANSLLHSLLASAAGDAELYVEGVEQTEDGILLRFGYQAGGVPIRFRDGQSAAEITVAGGVISDMTFRVRQYTVEGTASLLLPCGRLWLLPPNKRVPNSLLAMPTAGLGPSAPVGWQSNERGLRLVDRYLLKNIIIIILVLVNGFLLGSLSMRYWSAAKAQDQMEEQLVALFASDGMELDPDIISQDAPPSSLSLSRDLDREQAAAAFFWAATWLRRSER